MINTIRRWNQDRRDRRECQRAVFNELPTFYDMVKKGQAYPYAEGRELFSRGLVTCTFADRKAHLVAKKGREEACVRVDVIPGKPPKQDG